MYLRVEASDKDMARKVEVVPYDRRWAEQFKGEAGRITAVLCQEAQAIHHIGSTSIPGIVSKPIIDILVEVKAIEKVDEFNGDMIGLGYQPRGEYGIPGRRYFIRDVGATGTHHVHMFTAGDPQVERHLNFRDYMLAHPEEARAYSLVKEDLARRFPEDMDSYVEGKDGFIKEMDRRAYTWRQGTK